MRRFGCCSLLPNYTSCLFRRLQAKLLIREIREREREPLACLSFFLCLLFLMGHSIIIVHSSYSFFFVRPDLDLCGLPAWLLPWQHLEPSSSCWPCVFTEAQACSSLLRGFASPSKVSSHRLTQTPLTAGIVIRVSFTCLVLFPTKSLSHSRAGPRARIHTSSYVSSSYTCKERISCHMSNTGNKRWILRVAGNW